MAGYFKLRATRRSAVSSKRPETPPASHVENVAQTCLANPFPPLCATARHTRVKSGQIRSVSTVERRVTEASGRRVSIASAGKGSHRKPRGRCCKPLGRRTGVATLIVSEQPSDDES